MALNFYEKARLLLSKDSPETECLNYLDLINATANVDTDPPPLQLITENYKKAHIRIDGLHIVIETPQGALRKKLNLDGSVISAREMPFAYGYINNTIGADFSPIDVFVGDYPYTKMIYILDQMNKHDAFDEHKVFVWFRDKKQAKDCYFDSFEKRKIGKKKMMAIRGLHLTDFKEWLKTNGTMQPISQQDGFDFI